MYSGREDLGGGASEVNVHTTLRFVSICSFVLVTPNKQYKLCDWPPPALCLLHLLFLSLFLSFSLYFFFFFIPFLGKYTGGYDNLATTSLPHGYQTGCKSKRDSTQCDIKEALNPMSPSVVARDEPLQYRTSSCKVTNALSVM